MLLMVWVLCCDEMVVRQHFPPLIFPLPAINISYLPAVIYSSRHYFLLPAIIRPYRFIPHGVSLVGCNNQLNDDGGRWQVVQ